VDVADGGVSVARGDLDDSAVVFTGPASVIAAAVYGGVPLDELAAAGALSVEGSMKVAKRFVTLFPLPEKVEPPRAGPAKERAR
jgi:hypothetical protein